MNAENFWKLVFVISAVSFLVAFATVPKTHCEDCDGRFEKMSTEEFLDLYYETCIEVESVTDLIESNQLNITLNSTFK